MVNNNKTNGKNLPPLKKDWFKGVVINEFSNKEKDPKYHYLKLNTIKYRRHQERGILSICTIGEKLDRGKLKRY